MNEYIKQVCKIGQGAECCRYLGADTNGIQCFKIDLWMKHTIDRAWADTEHVAQGDNCAGQEELSAAVVTDLPPQNTQTV